jgi:hypothetical protein
LATCSHVLEREANQVDVVALAILDLLPLRRPERMDFVEQDRDGGTTAPAMTYMYQGRQYIVVATGWTDRPASWSR